MKRLLLSALALAGLSMATATTQSQPTTATRAEQTAQPTDTTSRAPQQGIGQVAQEQVAMSPRAFGDSTSFRYRYYGDIGPRRVKYGRSRWVLMS